MSFSLASRIGPGRLDDPAEVSSNAGRELFPDNVKSLNDDRNERSRTPEAGNGESSIGLSREALLRQQLLARRKAGHSDGARVEDNGRHGGRERQFEHSSGQSTSGDHQPSRAEPGPPQKGGLSIRDASRRSPRGRELLPERLEVGDDRNSSREGRYREKQGNRPSRDHSGRDESRTPPLRSGNVDAVYDARGRMSPRESGDDYRRDNSTRLSPERRGNGRDRDASQTRREASRRSNTPRGLPERRDASHRPIRHALPLRPVVGSGLSFAQPQKERLDGAGRSNMDRPPHMDRRSYTADTDERAERDRDRRGSDYGYGPRRDLDSQRGLPPVYQGRGGFDDRRNDAAGYGNGNGNGNGSGHGQHRPPARDNGYGQPVLPPQRIGFDAPPRHFAPGRGYRGGAIDFEQRRLQREASTLSIWPPSPKAPYRSESESGSDVPRRSKRRESKRKHRSKYSSASDTDSSEEDRRRRRRRRREREKGGGRSRKRRQASNDSESSESESEAGGRKAGRRHESRRQSGRSSRARTYSTGRSDDDVGRQARKGRKERKDKTDRDGAKENDAKEKSKDKEKEKEQPLTLEQLAAMQKAKAEEEEVVGPLPPTELAKLKGKTQFKDMLPGEAEAMALYLSMGDRIPRRGEVGYDADVIKALEDSGYVMSGSRHKRMNAVRLRKENQVISAEEKRAILNLQREERGRKEGVIISQFKELMDTAIKRSEAK